MKTKTLLIALFLLSIYRTFGQSPKVMNNWVFGWFAGLDFTTGTPTAFNGTSMISTEGSISYSDEQGNLLFYSNGGDDQGPGPGAGFGGVWNRNFQLMPNGSITNLTGCNSSPQPALIVPKSATEYYMFTVGCSEDPSPLRKSIIDMTLDGGLGDLTTVGESMLDNGYSLAEGLTGTRHANGTDIWLLVHASSGLEFYVFLVTSTGITGPFTQSVGLTSTNLGQLRFNIQGNKLAFNREIFDFDNATGTISNPVDLGQDNGWGRAFSASGRYFYQNSLYGELYQFDLQASDIATSKVTLHGLSNAYGGMQIGPDLKIYISQEGSTGLNVIEQPDMPGLSCNFTISGISLVGGATSTMGLPNFIDSDLAGIAGLQELESRNTFKVIPNPTSDFIQFDELSAQKEISVYSVAGKEMSNCQLEGNRLDVHKLDAGMYILHIGTSVAKFTKE